MPCSVFILSALLMLLARSRQAGACCLWVVAAAFVPLAAMASAAEVITALTCPEPKPNFDPARIDRTLKEPRYVSDKPLYHFFAFGPEGKQVAALVIDESQGPGKGYDTLYFDFNANRDITEPGEKMTLQGVRQPKPAPNDKGFFLVSLSDWGKPPILKRKLAINDPVFGYAITVEAASFFVDSTLKDGSWHTAIKVDDGRTLWSPQKESAQVHRFGGTEFSLRNEGWVGKTFKVGDPIELDLTAPFFAGCSPSVVFHGPEGGNWIPAGYEDISVRLESLANPSTEPVDITLRGY